MIRFGILGFGLHAEKRLAPAFRQARHACLMALSRRDPVAAKASAEKHAVPYAFTRAEELCQCPEIDAVVVATPNACHVSDTLLALRHGKAVLCEKPMALNAEQCGRMIGAAEAAGLLLGVAHVFRFHPLVLRMRDRITEGIIGPPVFARVDFSYAGRNHARKWLLHRNLGGGALADLGVHCIDALRFVLQDEVKHVRARASLDSNGVDSAAALLLEFSSGVLASVQVSLRAEYRTPFEVVGEAGALRANPALAIDQPVTLELVRSGVTVEREQFSPGDAFVRQLDSFALAVEGKLKFACPGEEGLRNQLALDAAYQQICK
jgi:1,5-anhydro-D-fructose reductase (1,5-anhydro-D-mannitol-forming)